MLGFAMVFAWVNFWSPTDSRVGCMYALPLVGRLELVSFDFAPHAC